MKPPNIIVLTVSELHKEEMTLAPRFYHYMIATVCIAAVDLLLVERRSTRLFPQPNGRFETNKKICLSISGHHPESWQPSWSIRTALLAIIGFMPTEGHGTIGSLDYPSDERKALAR